MSTSQAIEIDGALVGILAEDALNQGFYFRSGVAPYDLLDGSRFSRLADARCAIWRMSRAARPVRKHGDGDLQ